MRTIISKIMSMLSSGSSHSRGTSTRSRGGMLSRVVAALKAFFSGGRRR